MKNKSKTQEQFKQSKCVFPPENRYKPYTPLTIETARSFYQVEADGDYNCLDSYMLACRDIAAELTRIVDRTDNFKDLKKEIVDFAQDRRDFVKSTRGRVSYITEPYSLDEATVPATVHNSKVKSKINKSNEMNV